MQTCNLSSLCHVAIRHTALQQIQYRQGNKCQRTGLVCLTWELNALSYVTKEVSTMASSIEDLVDKLRDYDYIRCTFTDLFGVSRGKVLTTTSAAEFLTNGIGFYSGECQCDLVDLVSLVEKWRHDNSITITWHGDDDIIKFCLTPESWVHIVSWALRGNL